MNPGEKKIRNVLLIVVFIVIAVFLSFALSKKSFGATKEIRIGGKCLDVPSGQMVNGAKIQLWDCNHDRDWETPLSR